MTIRKFLYDTLRDLDKLAGLKQFQKLCEMDDSADQIADLLNKMVFIADQFKNIPENKKQEIIYAGVVTDPEFIGLNAKIVWRWLNAEAHKYIPKPVEEQKDWTPVQGEEREKWLEKWQESLGQLVENFKPEDLKEQRIADKRARFYGDSVPPPPPVKKPLSDHVSELLDKPKKDENL